MVPFAYAAAPIIDDAIGHVGRTRGAEFIAGGTDMLQLLHDGVRSPAELIDINRLPLAAIELGPDVLGLAEIALCGVAPAIANAVYDATGKRIRDLPITPEKLIT